MSLAQLAGLGVTRDALDHWLKVGRVHRLHRGVYAVGHANIGHAGRTLAAVLASGTGAVLSHDSAAAWWGLLHRRPCAIHVTAARGRRGGTGIVLHRSRCIDARDVTRHHGVPITTVERTLLDLASAADARVLREALDTAKRLGRYRPSALAALIARSNGHRGIGALARAARPGPAPTRSELERRFLALLRSAGLPEPLVNARVEAPDHPFLEVDFLWPAHALIVETDGYETHGTRRAFEADRAKDAALTAAGYRVVRFTWRTDGATVVSRLGVLLSPAGSRPRSGRSAR